jgi:hypothetical protein
MRSRRTPANLRTALWQQTRAVAEAVAQLLDLGSHYRRVASGPAGEPNRANEALLALERAKEALHGAVDCYEHPEPLNDRARFADGASAYAALGFCFLASLRLRRRSQARTFRISWLISRHLWLRVTLACRSSQVRSMRLSSGQ